MGVRALLTWVSICGGQSQCWVSSVALDSEVAHCCGQVGCPVENVLVCGTLSIEVTWSHSHACIYMALGGWWKSELRFSCLYGKP